MTIAGDTHVGKSQEGRELYEIGPENKGLFSRISKDWLLLGILLLTATAFFGLGLLAHRELTPPQAGEGLWIQNLSPEMRGASTSAPVTQKKAPTLGAAVVEAVAHTGEVVAAKTGKSYYSPSCGGAKRIKEENKVWFASSALAEAAGYTASKSCKGL